MKENICSAWLCLIIQSISQTFINPKEYRWNNCLHEKQHKCKTFAKKPAHAVACFLQEYLNSSDGHVSLI